MKEKLFDLVLVMLLLIVAFAVALTLFGPSFRLSDLGTGFGSSRRSNDTVSEQVSTIESSTTPGATNTEANANSSEVSVIVPTVDLPTIHSEENSETSSGSQTVNPEVSTIENSESNNATENSSSTIASTQETAVVAELPEGAIDLQSIGFSYVTGGAGACGVTLEAWKHVAVSRDILAKYPCGTKITVKIDKPINGHTNFAAIVGDTMNKKHTRTVNIYVAKTEPALEYGRQTGDLIP